MMGCVVYSKVPSRPGVSKSCLKPLGRHPRGRSRFSISSLDAGVQAPVCAIVGMDIVFALDFDPETAKNFQRNFPNTRFALKDATRYETNSIKPLVKDLRIQGLPDSVQRLRSLPALFSAEWTAARERSRRGFRCWPTLVAS